MPRKTPEESLSTLATQLVALCQTGAFGKAALTVCSQRSLTRAAYLAAECMDQFDNWEDKQTFRRALFNRL